MFFLIPTIFFWKRTQAELEAESVSPGPWFFQTFSRWVKHVINFINQKSEDCKLKHVAKHKLNINYKHLVTWTFFWCLFRYGHKLQCTVCTAQTSNARCTRAKSWPETSARPHGWSAPPILAEVDNSNGDVWNCLRFIFLLGFWKKIRKTWRIFSAWNFRLSELRMFFSEKMVDLKWL